jgi:hypothetical protein
MTPEALSKLLIVQLHADDATVLCDTSPMVQENHLCYVHTEADQFRQFRFRDVTVEQCVIAPWHLEYLSELTLGKQYAFLDIYWGERAALVYDRSRTWVLTKFENSAQILMALPNGGYVGRQWKPADEPLPQDVQVINGGHDHEHCRICWESIGVAGQTEGYCCTQQPQNDWVCVRCYESYVATRSLGFLVH